MPYNHTNWLWMMAALSVPSDAYRPMQPPALENEAAKKE